MEVNVKLPKIPDFEKIVKGIIEEELNSKVKEWAAEQALAIAKSVGGPAAIADNVDIEMEMTEAKTEIPTLTISTNVQSFSYSVPEVTMRTKVVAKLHVPEVYMARERLSFNHKHCKTVWKVKHICCGAKTKVPEVHCWETPAYADVPKTRMVLREIKTDVPEVKMRLDNVKIELPAITVGTSLVSLNVPKVSKVTFDIAGLAKEFVPGGSILSALLEILEQAEEFRKKLEEKIDKVITTTLEPVFEELQDLKEDVITAIDKVQDKYAAIIREMEDAAGEHSEEIRKQANKEIEEVAEMKKQLEPIVEMMDRIEFIRNKAKSLVKNLKLL